MILKQTIDSVLARADIVEVVSQFVQLKKSGANYKGLSPFSNERTPSFMVSAQKGIYKDFSSGKGGGPVNFIMEHEHISYPEAIRWLANKYGIEVLEQAKTEQEVLYEQQKESMFLITDATQKYFLANLTREYSEYITQTRGMTPGTQQKFGVGIAPPTMAGLCNELVTMQGFNWELCVAASVIRYKDKTIYDYFRDRITFPIRNLQGRIEGFGGRAMNWKKGDNFPKYLNSADSFIYNKGNVVYGLYESKKAIVENNMCYLSEGYTDVIGFHDAGIENIVAVSGTSFTPEQARLIRRFAENLTVLFDGDDAGIRAALRGIDIALSEGFTVKVCVLPDNQDPDDFQKGKTKEEILDFINKNSKDFIVFKLNYLLKNADDFTSKGNVITDVISSIARVSNPIQREVYIKECSRITDVDTEPLKLMMNQVMSNDKQFFDTLPIDEVNAVFENKQMLMEQCEARILQYLLCYKTQQLAFKEIYLKQTNMGWEEHFTIEETTVADKINTTIKNDGIAFINMQYAQIMDIALERDISDESKWLNIFGSELFLIAERLRNEQQAMNLTSFAKEGVRTYEYIMKDRIEQIQNGLLEAIFYYKVLFVENLIAEELKKEIPDMEMMMELMDFNVTLKNKLNML